MSPTNILQDNINLSKRETRKMIESGGLDCITKGVFGLMEAGGKGDMKAVDIIINRLDGLMSERMMVKPIIVEVVDYGDN